MFRPFIVVMYKYFVDRLMLFPFSSRHILVDPPYYQSAVSPTLTPSPPSPPPH
jgi:hypothetical protein